MIYIAWLFLLAAALLEVGGDAIIRHGLRNRNLFMILMGLIVLSSYGLVVNTVKWDLSRLLGVYVCFFALVSILISWLVLRETISFSNWLGLSFIIIGGLIIQFGSR